MFIRKALESVQFKHFCHCKTISILIKNMYYCQNETKAEFKNLLELLTHFSFCLYKNSFLNEQNKAGLWNRKSWLESKWQILEEMGWGFGIMVKSQLRHTSHIWMSGSRLIPIQYSWKWVLMDASNDCSDNWLPRF